MQSGIDRQLQNEGGGGGPTIALVQSNKSRTGSVAFPSGVTAGNVIIATQTRYQFAGLAVPTDTGGRTYTLMRTESFVNDVAIATWWAPVGGTGGANTVSFSSTGDVAMVVSEWSSMATTSPVDTTNIGSGTGTAVNAGSVDPAGTSNLIYAAMGHNNGNTTMGVDTANGFSLLQEETNGNTGMVVGVQYKIDTTGAAITPNWTLGASAGWAAQVGVFKV